MEDKQIMERKRRFTKEKREEEGEEEEEAKRVWGECECIVPKVEWGFCTRW